MRVDYLGILYALLVAGLGIYGYIKAGSTVSLLSGVAFAVLIGVGAFLISRNPRHFYVSLIVALVLGAVMGWRFYEGNWKFIPAGLIFVISLAMAVWYGVVGYIAYKEP